METLELWISLVTKNVKAGNGLFQAKNKAEYLADSFHFETHIITNEGDFVIHSGSVSGLGIDIAEETTGAIGADNVTNGHSMTIKNIEQIYIDVEWNVQGSSENLQERIELYNPTKEEPSFIGG